MPLIVINDEKESKEQMRSSMREHMRRNYRGGGGYRSYSGGGEHYRTEEAYKEGYEHGWRDSEDDMYEENMRRGRDSRGRFV